MPSAPLSISTQSRNKLQTFVFEANSTRDAPGHDKENTNDEMSKCVSLVNSQKFLDNNLLHSSPLLPQLPSEKQCPQTPANRIPLADLIGNTEDAFNCDPKDTTPEDHICWQHGPSPQSSVPSAGAKSARRGKKRARSSSPATASQNQKSAHINAEESLDLKMLHESLKTPHNDPALDLWARYTDASLMKKDVNGKALPAFAHLMTSSPQTPGTTNSKDGGLKRSISCGIEWPASKSKKRKVGAESAEGRMKDVFEASKTDIMACGKSKGSRITLLMEKLQENSRKVPQIEVSGPSSSSPLPNRIGLSNSAALSPVPKRMAAGQRNNEALSSKGEGEDQCMHDVSGRRQDDAESVSSEFGDEDIGLDLLEAAEQSECVQTAMPVTEQQSAENLTIISDDPHQDDTHQICAGPVDHSGDPQAYGPLNNIPPQASHTDPRRDVEGLAKVVPSAFDDDDDEFGDENYDSLVLADLAARFDTQQPTHAVPPHAVPPHAVPTHAQVEGVLPQQDVGYKTHSVPVQDAAEDGGDDGDDDAYDDVDDDDLWNQIGSGSLVLPQDKGVMAASQVRVVF
jgi:hypothetical protein